MTAIVNPLRLTTKIMVMTDGVEVLIDVDRGNYGTTIDEEAEDREDIAEDGAGALRRAQRRWKE